MIEARERAHQEGPIDTVMENMHPEGYWEKAGPGYLPKYRSTVWALILLGQLGASIETDPQIETTCRYYLEHALTDIRADHNIKWAWRNGRLPAGKYDHRFAGPGLLG